MGTDDIIPRPDPTILTTAQLDRAIESLESRIDARIDAMDKASRLLHEDFTRVPTEMDRRLGHLQELIFSKLDAVARVTEQQFNAIGMRFEEMDKRTAQLSVADKTAIAAALQAQKEAAGAQNESNAAANAKMEKNFAELIAQNQTLLMEVRRNNEIQIGDLKSRVDKAEAHGKGVGDVWGWVVGGVGMLFGLASIIALVGKWVAR